MGDLNLIQFITKEFVWLIPCLFVLGKMYKGIPNLPNWLIPFMLIGTGILLAGFMSGFNSVNMMQGLISGLAATGLHQNYKMAKINNEKKENK